MDELEDFDFEEDFSETPQFAEDEPLPKVQQPKEVKRNILFEILNTEDILKNVFEMIEKVQNFIGVSVCNGIFLVLEIFNFSSCLSVDKYKRIKNYEIAYVRKKNSCRSTQSIQMTYQKKIRKGMRRKRRRRRNNNKTIAQTNHVDVT